MIPMTNELINTRIPIVITLYDAKENIFPRPSFFVLANSSMPATITNIETEIDMSITIILSFVC